MALVKSGSSREYCYAAIRNIQGDKGNNITQVNVGLWYDLEDRNSNIADGETLPPARDAKICTIQGYDLSLAQIYTTLLTLPEWANWSSDEE